MNALYQTIDLMEEETFKKRLIDGYRWSLVESYLKVPHSQFTVIRGIVNGYLKEKGFDGDLHFDKVATREECEGLFKYLRKYIKLYAFT